MPSKSRKSNRKKARLNPEDEDDKTKKVAEDELDEDVEGEGEGDLSADQQDETQDQQDDKEEKQEEGEEEGDEDDDDEEEEEEALAYRWIDRGTTGSNGVSQHQLLEMIVKGKSTVFSVGDTILLRSDTNDVLEDEEEDDEDDEEGKKDDSKRNNNEKVETAFVARVERMWQEPPPSNKRKKQQPSHLTHPEYFMKVRTRWFFKKMDVEQLSGKNLMGPVSKKELLQQMTNRDLILSNQWDDNDVLTLLGKCNVIFRQPDRVPTPLPPLPSRTFCCRYQLDFGEGASTATITPYSGNNHKWPHENPPASSKKRKRKSITKKSQKPPPEEKMADTENKTHQEETAQEHKDVEMGQSDDTAPAVNAATAATVTIEETKAASNDQMDEDKIDDINSSPALANQEEKREENDNESDVSKMQVDGQDGSQDMMKTETETDDATGGEKEETATADDTGTLASRNDGDDKNNTNENDNQEGTNEGDADSMSSSDEEDDGNDDDLSSAAAPPSDDGTIMRDEGTTKGQILVGPEYQAQVPSFTNKEDSEAPIIRSRNPTLVWQRHAGRDDEIDEYLERAAQILVPYLDQRNLLMKDPYLPLANEKLMQKSQPQQPSSKEEQEAGEKQDDHSHDPEPKSDDTNKEKEEDEIEKSKNEKNAEIDKKYHHLDSLSMLSTAYSMSSSYTRKHLSRECKIDALLALLHEKEYNVEAAHQEIASNPTDYIVSWTEDEKLRFDDGFRKFSGSLRMISKNMAVDNKNNNVASLEKTQLEQRKVNEDDGEDGKEEKKKDDDNNEEKEDEAKPPPATKGFKDVVDFHYRFKIPDQFRKRQDRKRAYAARMMEIIEDRRSYDSYIPTKAEEMQKKMAQNIGASVTGEGPSSKTKIDWSKTSVSDFTSETNERRVNAKDFLLQVRATLGDEKLRQLSVAIKSFQRRRFIELKDRAVEILQDTPTLLNKFVEFLPKRYRE